MYRSPNITKESDVKLNYQIKQATKELKDLIIFGDFNHPDIDWENNHCRKNDYHPSQIFLQSIMENNIKQHVLENTHHKPKCKASLIDLVLTKNNNNRLNKIKMLPPIGKSHHSTILTSVNISQESSENTSKVKKISDQQRKF